MIGHESFDPEGRDKGIAAMVDYIKGGDYKSVFELGKDLEFKAEREVLAESLQTATPAERNKLHFDLAVYRSLRYAVASSKHTLVLGAVNGIRELYEGKRLTAPLRLK